MSSALLDGAVLTINLKIARMVPGVLGSYRLIDVRMASTIVDQQSKDGQRCRPQVGC